MSGYIKSIRKRDPDDDLARYVRAREAREPGFKSKVADAEARAEARMALAARLREARGKRTQAWVAAQMQTTESIVRRIERGDDVRVSVIGRLSALLRS